LTINDLRGPEMIKLLLAEDHTIVRKGLRSLLDSEEAIEVVGEAEDGREAVKKVEELEPHVVVMDISMPGLNGLEATRQIKKRFPRVRVLILSVHTDEEHVYQALRAGASGYVVKKSAPDELFSAINALFRGDSYLSPAISREVIEAYIHRAERMPKEDEYELLTPREREILQLIAEGRSTRQIGALLHISPKTVETHRAHIMEKLNLHTTAELTRYAIHKGLIP